MKAIIVAAGPARRLRPVTNRIPKCLLRVGGKTILEWQLDSLRACGVRKVVLVTGYLAGKIESFCGLRVEYVYNPFYNVTNNLASLWFAREKMAGGFIYLHSDVIFERNILGDLLDTKYNICIAVALKKCDKEDMKVQLKSNYVVEINKSMSLKKASGEFIGLAKFSPSGIRILVPVLDEIMKEGNHNVYFAQALQRIADRRNKVYTSFTDGKFWEIDFKKDLDEVRRYFNKYKYLV